MKRVVLVGARVMADGYLAAAGDRGWSVGVVETADRIKEMERQFPGVIADAEVIEQGHYPCEEAWVPVTAALVDRMKPDGIIAFTEENVLAASLMQESLGLPGPGLLAARVARNKALQRVVFQRNGLPQPEFHITPTLSQATDWARTRLPVVVKPLTESGSVGVEYVADEAGWTEVTNRPDGGGARLVEEFVDGTPYSWEALVQDGVVRFSNLTLTERTRPPHFVCVLHEVGIASDRPSAAALADQLGGAVVAAMGMSTGLVHLELLERPNGEFVVVEVAARNPGAFLVEIMSRSYRVDLFAAYLDAAVGEQPTGLRTPPTAPVRPGALVKLYAERAGRLRRADLDRLHAVPGMVRCGMRLEVGTAVRPPQSLTDVLGYAILDCDSRSQLRESILLTRNEAVIVID